jgi:hypothetical protein
MRLTSSTSYGFVDHVWIYRVYNKQTNKQTLRMTGNQIICVIPITQVLKFLCLIVEYVERINANQRYFRNNLYSNRKLNFPLYEFCH